MIYTISNDYLTVKVSSKGGELQSVCTNDGREYLWQGDPASWNRHAPHLFPFVGRLTNGRYFYKGTEYKMGQHGFLRDNEMELEALEDSRLVLTFKDNENTRAMYPFKFKFTLTYTLENNTLKTSYDVFNPSDETIYFGLGGHPGFNVPFDDELEFEDFYLQFEDGLSPRQTPLTENFFIAKETIPYTFEDGNRINLKHNLFNHDAIILSNTGKTVEIKSPKSNHSLLFNFDSFEFIAFWQAMNTDARFICIEPWASYASHDNEDTDFETKKDLIKLQAGKTANRHWSITIK